jgi:hypothetical protein
LPLLAITVVAGLILNIAADDLFEYLSPLPCIVRRGDGSRDGGRRSEE